MTTTTRERFDEKFCFKQTDDWVTHYPSLRTNIDQTEAIWSFIETIEKEAEERMKEKCLACVPKIEQSVLDSYDEGNSRDDAYQKWCMMESQVIRNSISSL